MLNNLKKRVKFRELLHVVFIKINDLLLRLGYSKIAIIIVLIIVIRVDYHLALWKRTTNVIAQDVYAYYAYLPSIFIYNDLTLDYLHGGTSIGDQFITWSKTTPEGKKVITASMGMSYLYFPFFLVAHVYAHLTDNPVTGYSPPYRFAIVFANVFFLAIGLYYLKRLLSKYFTDFVTGIVIIILPLTTNMLWYIVVESGMTHVFSFSLIAVFVYLLDCWYEKTTFKRTFLLGLLAGLIALIRPTNILILVLFFFWNVKTWKNLVERVMFFLKKWNHVLLMILSFFIFWIPQFMYWKMQTGQYLYYSYPDDQGFFFGNPQIWNNLFSWRKGWLLYTPVMIFALAGIPLLWKQNRKFFIPIVIFVAVFIYVTASWWDWWYGGGFGIRAYIDIYGILGIPMAALLTWAFARKFYYKLAILTLFFLITARSTFHYFQYHYGACHWSSMTREAFFDSFWRVTPSDKFKDLIRDPDYNLARKGIYKYADEEKK
jgi:hypothetical protein